MNRPVRALAAATIALLGCPKSSEPPSTTTPASSEAGGEVVARIGDTVITQNEVKARLAELPPISRQRYQNEAQKKEFVETLVKNEILSQEAKKQGLDKSAATQSQFKRMLVQELIKSYNEQKVDVSDDDLKKYYEKHIDDYVKPEKVRVQHIFLAAPEGGDAAAKKARAEAKAKAASMETKLKAAQAALAKGPATVPPSAPLQALSDLAKAESADTMSKNVGGDLRFLSEDELKTKFSPEFAKAAFALTAEAPLSAVIETPKGFHIARLLGRQPATNQAFDDEKFKGLLKDRYLAETRSARFDEYYQGLKKDANVSIDETALAKVEVPKGPGSSPVANAPPHGMPSPQMSGMPGGTPGVMPHPLPAGARPPTPMPMNHPPVASTPGHP